MADTVNKISQIVVGGTTYAVTDADAQSRIAALESYTEYLGVTSDTLTDGCDTNPVTINGEAVTAETGNIVNSGSKELIWNGTVWQEFGDLSGLGDLAMADTASGNVTFGGTVTASHSLTATVSGTYTPVTIQAPQVTPTPETFTAVNVVNTVVTGVDNAVKASVSGETLTLTVTTPTTGAAITTTEKTVLKAVNVAAPTYASATGSISGLTGSVTGTITPDISNLTGSVTVSRDTD